MTILQDIWPIHKNGEFIKCELLSNGWNFNKFKTPLSYKGKLGALREITKLKIRRPKNTISLIIK